MRTRRGLRVAVTGAAGYLGSRLVAALARWDEVERVLAMDVRPLPEPLPKVRGHLHDVVEPLDALFAEERPEVVVHLAYLLRTGHDRQRARRVNVGGTDNLLRACARAGVRQVIYLSSTSVYGAHPNSSLPLNEESSLRPVRSFAYSEDKVASERLLAEYQRQRPESIVTVLRVCVVMGPNARNFITQALTKRVMVGVLGADPSMQFCHEEDILALLLHLVGQPRRGVFNVVGEGTVRYSELVHRSGRSLVWLPAAVLYPLIQALWVLRLQSDSPACGLDFIRWPWVASAERLKAETGFSIRFTSEQALEAFLAARRGQE